MADLAALASALDTARASVRVVLRPAVAEAAAEARAALAAVTALAAAGRLDTAERAATEAAEAEGLRGELRAALAEAVPLAEACAAPPGASPSTLAEALDAAGYLWRPGDPVVAEAAWPTLPGWEGPLAPRAAPLRRASTLAGGPRLPPGAVLRAEGRELPGAALDGWTVGAPPLRAGWALTLDASGRWRILAPGGTLRAQGDVGRAPAGAIEAVALAGGWTLTRTASLPLAPGESARAELPPGDGAAEVRARVSALRALLSRLPGAVARGWSSALAPLAAALDARGGLATPEAEACLRAARAYEHGAALLAAWAPGVSSPG